MRYKAYRFRIYPTLSQEQVLRQTIGCCRFVYNWALAQKREAWALHKKSLSYGKVSSAMTELKKQSERQWLNDVSSVCLQQSVRNLDAAFSRFFKKQSSYPAFKSRKSGGSARFMDNAFRLHDGNLFLAKIKEPVKVRWSRNLSTTPSCCTVSLNASGQWFVSFLCEEEILQLPESTQKVGVDLGVESFVTLSDGRKISQPAKIRGLRKKMVRLQRVHSRKLKRSKNRERARRKLARVHQRVCDVRTDFLHKLSTQLVRENQTIALEDLAVSNMVRNRKLARCISEQGWREFRAMLEYKCQWYGRDLLIADRFYASSKTCSHCGAKANFGLETRQWTCGSCGANHDRDVNAARNILAAGQAVPACGVDGRPAKNTVLRGNRRRSTKPKAQAKESLSL